MDDFHVFLTLQMVPMKLQIYNVLHHARFSRIFLTVLTHLQMAASESYSCLNSLTYIHE